MDLTLIDFDSPTDVRELDKGRFDVYRVGLVLSGQAAVKLGSEDYAA